MQTLGEYLSPLFGEILPTEDYLAEFPKLVGRSVILHTVDKQETAKNLLSLQVVGASFAIDEGELVEVEIYTSLTTNSYSAGFRDFITYSPAAGAKLCKSEGSGDTDDSVREVYITG